MADSMMATLKALASNPSFSYIFSFPSFSLTPHCFHAEIFHSHSFTSPIPSLSTFSSCFVSPQAAFFLLQPILIVLINTSIPLAHLNHRCGCSMMCLGVECMFLVFFPPLMPYLYFCLGMSVHFTHLRMA